GLNIGFVATRLAGVDGVSLETAKLATVFQEMGHNAFYCAGELDKFAPPGRLVPAMHFTDPVAKNLHDEAFRQTPPKPEIFRRIYNMADYLRGELEAFVDEYKIDLIVPQNACAIPMNLS